MACTGAAGAEPKREKAPKQQKATDYVLQSTCMFYIAALFFWIVLRWSEPNFVHAFRFSHGLCVRCGFLRGGTQNGRENLPLPLHKPLTLPTQHSTWSTALMAENDSKDFNEKEEMIRSKLDERSKYRKGRRRRRRRHENKKFIHHESHVTAAGAESLFSLSWWPLFSYYETASFPSAAQSHNFPVDSSNLPSIDCDWACVSNKEKNQLQQMKLLLQSELKIVTDNNLHEIYPDVYSDLRLLRFLRKSKERDVAQAAERYRSFLEWREQNEVDKIRAMLEESSSSFFTPTDERLQTVATYFPMNFNYVNESIKGENVVKPAILNVGQFNTRGITDKILSSGSDIVLEDFLNYWIFLYESIHVQLYQQSVQFGQMQFLDEVCDLSGLSLQQFSPSFVTKVMSPWLKMTQAHYPETTRRIYILHPPAIVKVAWKLVTPLLSQGTIDKIRFVRKFDGSANEFVESKFDRD